MTATPGTLEALDDLRREIARWHDRPDAPRIPGRLFVAAAAVAGRTTEDAILSRRRGYPLVRWRHAGMTLATERTRLSLPQIGRIFSRDHTTVLHARDAVDWSRPANAAILELVNGAIDALVEDRAWRGDPRLRSLAEAGPW